jgi:ABC-type cobalamin/Fe3+-siderophores transport system ATPase subunit
MQPHVILLNGPAGVGKTTIGRCLAGLSPDGVCIHGDTLREFVVTRTSTHILSGMAYVNGATLAANYLRAGYQRVVFEFVFEHPRHVERFLAAFDASTPVFLFTLWAPLPTILQRERSRTNREPLGERVGECYRALEQELDQLGTVVPNETESPDEIAQRIESLCKQGVGIIS